MRFVHVQHTYNGPSTRAPWMNAFVVRSSYVYVQLWNDRWKRVHTCTRAHRYSPNAGHTCAHTYTNSHTHTTTTIIYTQTHNNIAVRCRRSRPENRHIQWTVFFFFSTSAPVVFVAKMASLFDWKFDWLFCCVCTSEENLFVLKIIGRRCNTVSYGCGSVILWNGKKGFGRSKINVKTQKNFKATQKQQEQQHRCLCEQTNGPHTQEPGNKQTIVSGYKKQTNQFMLFFQ